MSKFLVRFFCGNAIFITLFRLALASFLIVCGSATANVVSVGALSSNDDGNSSSIFDSLNGREWLRWDVLKGLTYAQTVALTTSGSRFDGWSVARNQDALSFLTALLGPNSCAVINFDVCINSVSNDVQRLMGDSYSPNVQGGPYNDFDDYIYFLSDNGFGYEVGVIETLKFRNATVSSVFFKHEQWQIVDADRAGTRLGEEMGWLLYRDLPLNVPEPGSIWLVLLGLLVTYTMRGARLIGYVMKAMMGMFPPQTGHTRGNTS